MADRKINVSTLSSHFRLDGDDVIGMYVAAHHNRNPQFVIENPHIKLYPGRDHVDNRDDRMLAEGELMIGICGGMCDEHPFRTSDGKPDECAATLVAKKVTLSYGDPALQPMLHYAKQINSKPVAIHTQFAALVKHALRHFDGDYDAQVAHAVEVIFTSYVLLNATYLQEQCILEHQPIPNPGAAEAFDVIIAQYLLTRRGGPNAKSLNAYLARPLDKGDCYAKMVARDLGFADSPAYKNLLEYAYATRSLEAKTYSHRFEIATMVRSAFHQMQGSPEEKAQQEADLLKGVYLFLDGLYMKDHKYHVLAPRELADEEKTTKAMLTNSRGGKVLMLMVQTENTEIARYCTQVVGAAVVIKVQENGYFQVHSNQKFGLTMAFVAKWLRLKFRSAKKIFTDLDEEVLLMAGDGVNGAREVYYDQDHSQVFVGNLTNEKKVDIKLDPKQIFACVYTGGQEEFYIMRAEYEMRQQEREAQQA
jgi:hypothetical protein